MDVEYDEIHLLFIKMRRPPRSTQSRSSAASDVYKRQDRNHNLVRSRQDAGDEPEYVQKGQHQNDREKQLSLIHISETTRPY